MNKTYCAEYSLSCKKQEIIKKCTIFINSLPAIDDFCHLQTVSSQIRPNKTLSKFWIQIGWHSDGMPKRNF